MEVADWLRGLGLEQYAPAFVQNDIGWQLLSELSADDLKELGVASLGHRRQLLAAIAVLRGTPEQALPAAPRAAARPAAERRQITVLFCDLVGSTALSVRLDPEDLRGVIGAYHRCCAEVIERAGGFVAKYMGDGVLAYFGYPAAHEDDAERAVRAGLELIPAVRGLDGGSPLQTRIGIATGLVVVGDVIGQGAAHEQAVVGETPNLAARLQGLAEPDMVVIAASTRRLLGRLFEYRDLGPASLKGFAEPVAAYQVIRPSAEPSRFEALRSEQTPLVGREEELDLLLRRWEQARSGEGRVVLISGEPGIGKSRLVSALQQRLPGEPQTRLRYFCSPHHQHSPYHPIIAQLERAAGFEREALPEDKLAKLEILLAQSNATEQDITLIAGLLSLPLGGRQVLPEMSQQRRKAETLNSLLAQLERLAAQKPLLIIHEDVHWIDPSSTEVLDRMIAHVARLPVLLLATFRPGFAAPWVGQAHVTLLSLNRLARREGAALIERIAGGKALPPEVFEQVLARTDGVPLFVEELTKTVLESGLLREEAGHYVLSGPLPPLAIPTTLQDSLTSRLDRLAPVREVAQIGAAIGRVFPHTLLLEVTRSTDSELQEALNRLISSELVFCQGRPPDAIYTFKHALVRDAAYESLLKSKRAELHARIAKALEERFPEAVEAEPELLAQHYTEAGLAQPAIGYWLRAGERAARRSAHQEASAHLRKGLTLVGALPDSSDRARREIELQTRLGAALIPLKGQAAPEVGEAYARARDLCEQTGDAAKLYPILQGLWHFHAVRAELGRARELAERCHAMARREGDPAHLLAAHHVLTGCLAWSGEFEASRDHLASALEVENRAQHRAQASLIEIDLRIFVRGFGAHSVWHLGYAEQAGQLSDEAVTLAREGRDPFSLALALDYAAMLCQFARDHRGADQLASEAISICAERHFAYYLAWATIVRGWARATGGSVGEGLAEIGRGLAEIEATGARLRRPYFLSLLADALVRAGRPEEALAALEEALGTGKATGERWREADLHRRRGYVLLTMPDRRAGDVEACFTTALHLARCQNALALELQAALDLTRLWADRGQRRKAHELLIPIHARFTEGFDTKDLKEAKALLHELGESARHETDDSAVADSPTTG